jgi:hypothetical protein
MRRGFAAVTIRSDDFFWGIRNTIRSESAILEITVLIEWFRERLNFEILVNSDRLRLNMEHVLRIHMF